MHLYCSEVSISHLFRWPNSVNDFTHRLVPLSDHQYDSQLQMMVATLKIPLKRQNGESGIWEITDRTVRIWLNEAVEVAVADGVR